MNEKEFIGELRHLEPQKIIRINDNNLFDNFFLILGLIYNDFKSLNFYSILLNDQFIGKNTGEINCDSGEYHGMKNHLNKLMMSTIYEFLEFLKNQSKVINSSNFKIILSKLSSTENKLWQQMLDIATKENLTERGNNFVEILEEIRNNGSFHYYSSGQKLRNGFIDHFYNRRSQHKSNELAYYSKGDCMKDVRYFYCDAAFQGFSYTCGKNKISYEEYTKALLEITEKMNVVIMTLMKRYIATRK